QGLDDLALGLGDAICCWLTRDEHEFGLHDQGDDFFVEPTANLDSLRTVRIYQRITAQECSDLELLELAAAMALIGFTPVLATLETELGEGNIPGSGEAAHENASESPRGERRTTEGSLQLPRE